MQVKVTRSAGQARIAIDGRFDFGCRQAFSSACSAALAATDVKEMVVDLDRVAYLDSAALGMLLLLREKASTARMPLRLTHGSGVVGDVLRVTKFDQLFAMQ